MRAAKEESAWVWEEVEALSGLEELELVDEERREKKFWRFDSSV